MATASMPSPQIDLFLSYNRQDQDVVLKVCRELELRGIHTFLDRDHLAAGLPWPQALEQALRSSRGVAVFLGPHDLGTWQKREMFFALDLQSQAERENRTFPVIPVLLKDAQPQPGFLFLNTWADFRNAQDEAEEFEALMRAIQQDERSAGWQESSVCPYFGLRAFREEDQALYFGRDAFIEQLLHKLSAPQSILAVVGPSGSGKSSVVMAGLLPRLRRLRAPAWDSISFTPGDHPWFRLAYALIPLLEPDLSEVTRIAKAGELAAALMQRNGILSATLVRALERTQGSSRLLLIVDQFEELFTLAPKVEDLKDDTAIKEAEEQNQKRSEFLEDLLACTRSAPVTVLLTLRADYYGHALAASRALCDALNTGQIALGPLVREELEQAIERPAKLVGLQFEPGLRNRILDDVSESPGSLPLLEYALSQLWSERRNGVLTSSAYDAFGGVAGAIGDKAEGVYSTFSDTEQQATRSLFGRLVRVSPADMDGSDTRQRATRQELGEIGWQIALRLAAPGVWLLVTSRDPQTDQETVEVAHEALIRNWKTLRNWLRDDREFLLWRQQFQVFLSIWNGTGGKDETALLPGPALDEALNWRKLKGGDLNVRECALITHSEKARKKSYQRQVWKRRVATAAALVAAAAGLARLGYMQTDIYQIDTIVKNAPVRVVSETTNDVYSESAVKEYFEALGIYNSEEAHRTAQLILDANLKAMALNSIATAQAKAGQLAQAGMTLNEAQRTAQLIPEAYRKAEVLNLIATAQADAGQLAQAGMIWNEAQRTAQLIPEAYWKTGALKSIATAQAKAGQWKAAKIIADSCPTTVDQLQAYGAILMEYAKSKNSKLRANLERQEQD